MSRCLIVGLLLTPVLMAAPVPREDDVGRMHRIYGTTHDPDDGAEFRPSGNTLRIVVPHEPRLLSPWSKMFNAPRVWREVRGDFTATVRVSFPIRSAIPRKHEEVSESRSGGGLVVWLDEQNLLTVTRDEHEFEGEPGEFFRSELRNEGSATGYSKYSAPTQSGYVRAERTEKQFVGSYSTDGKTWKRLDSYELEWGESTRVGVVAENSYKAPFEIVFDEYVLTRTK
jgi:regulation of enolase protein 1 (concanavalin A-like superfamily)